MDSTQKRKKNFYKSHFPKKTKYLGLKPGLKGVLCTCNNREKECIREAFNILHEYGDKLYGSEHDSTLEDQVEEQSDDIEADFNKEIKNLQAESKKQPNSRRFNLLSSKANNCIFIQTKLPEPVELVRYIVNDLNEKQKQRTMFLLRMIPVEVTCKAFVTDMEDAAKELFKKYFAQEGKTFAIIYKRRNNSSLLRDDVIKSLARIVMELNPLNRADLKQPELAVLVEVICNICCLSVVPDYFKFCKYNLLEICLQKEKPPKETHVEEIVQQNTAVEITQVGEIVENIDDKCVKITSCKEIVKQDADDTEVKIAISKESVTVEEILKEEADDTKGINCKESGNVEEIVKERKEADTEVTIGNSKESGNVDEIVKEEADDTKGINSKESGNVEEIAKQEADAANCKENVNI